MLVAIRDSLSDLEYSDDGEDGEDEDEEESEQGKLSKHDESRWVMGTITTTVQQHMERFRQKQMKLEEVTQPEWEHAADYFRERDKKYSTSELTVQQSFSTKRMTTLWHLQWQHFESIWSVLTLSLEYRKGRKVLLDQEVVILG